jgi:peptidoglycan-associated lipoprotein
MKTQRLLTLVLIGLVAGFAATGCKKKPQRTTPLPNQTAVGVGDNTSGAPINGGMTPSGPGTVKPNDLKETESGHEVSNRSIEGRAQDRQKFQAYTVLFDFDSSVVKGSERSKVDSVANEFKAGDAQSDLLIEGHCDERGTSEYNRSLGERRAQSLRETLIAAGLNANRIHTISFGKDKPAALGHDESSWSKNRRGEFILVLPK